MAMWDLPEQHHPIHGKKRKIQHEDISLDADKLLKTTSDFVLTGVGVTAMIGLGGAMIGALKPK